MKVGLIADTHGLLRPQVADVFQGVDAILHAGDIGKPEVLDELASMAPLTVIKGNVDRGEWAAAVPDTLTVSLGGCSIYLLHDVKTLDLDPAAAGVRVVMSGHSHKPRVREQDEVLYVNPGSAGPRRFTLPVSVGLLHIDRQSVRAEICELSI